MPRPPFWLKWYLESSIIIHFARLELRAQPTQDLNCSMPNWASIWVLARWKDNSWASADSLGTANNLFAENNLDYSNGYLSMNDCEQDDSLANRGGCRFVIRYNTVTVTGTSGGFGIAQNHGTDSGGRARGGRSAEVYGNTFNCHVSSGGCAGLEGGQEVGLESTLPMLSVLPEARPAVPARWACLYIAPKDRGQQLIRLLRWARGLRSKQRR